MLLLNTTTDAIRVVTSASISIDVHASWVDIVSTTITPGKTNTAITTATTTVVVGSPASSVARTIKTLIIRNKHATTAQTVTVQFYDGTTAYELISVTLSAGEILYYQEAAGFFVHDTFGRVKQNQNNGGSVAAVNSFNTVVLASNVVNNNAVANTIADVTGLSFSVTSGETYWFQFIIPYQSAATTTGSRWSVNGPASPTTLSYMSEYSLTATSNTINSANAYDLPAAANATSAYASSLGGNVARITGIIKPSANGTLIARFASEVASSAITAFAGALCVWVRTL